MPISRHSSLAFWIGYASKGTSSRLAKGACGADALAEGDDLGDVAVFATKIGIFGTMALCLSAVVVITAIDREVAKPPRRSKAAVMASLMTEPGKVKLSRAQ